MNAVQVQSEALTRASTGQSFGNYPAIFSGFMARGIAEIDIEPRVNVFTYHAWKALGRQVRKGEHGVKVTTYVPCQKKSRDKATGEETVTSFRRPKVATVFHVSQTDPIA